LGAVYLATIPCTRGGHHIVDGDGLAIRRRWRGRATGLDIGVLQTTRRSGELKVRHSVWRSGVGKCGEGCQGEEWGTEEDGSSR